MGTLQRHASLIILFLLLWSAPGSTEVIRWQIDGELREAIIYAPDISRTNEKIPVVLAFHGYGDNMQNFQQTKIHDAWSDALVVYFQGLNRRGGLRGWQIEQDGRNRDLKLVDVALSSLQERYNVDKDRIYATGFSNGGMFAYLLWLERANVFAAYAPVAAYLRPSARPQQAKPIFHVAGKNDRVVAFSDQQTTIALALEVNRVADSKTECGIDCTLYGDGTDAPVMTWIHPGGHTYPRETSERIVSFFSLYSQK